MELFRCIFAPAGDTYVEIFFSTDYKKVPGLQGSPYAILTVRRNRRGKILDAQGDLILLNGKQYGPSLWRYLTKNEWVRVPEEIVPDEIAIAVEITRRRSTVEAWDRAIVDDDFLANMKSAMLDDFAFRRRIAYQLVSIWLPALIVVAFGLIMYFSLR